MNGRVKCACFQPSYLYHPVGNAKALLNVLSSEHHLKSFRFHYFLYPLLSMESTSST